jgi:hypothetical protein
MGMDSFSLRTGSEPCDLEFIYTTPGEDFDSVFRIVNLTRDAQIRNNSIAL